MNNKTEGKTAGSSAGNTAIYKVVIEAPIEDVWAELVDRQSPKPYLFNSILETPALEAGAPYRMVSKKRRNVAVIGDILEIDPPHRMVQSFRFTQFDDAPCKVTYLLKPVSGGVEFSLITEDVPAGTKTEKSMADGGKFIVNNFKSWVESRKPTFSGRLILTMIDVTEPFAPKNTRIENWPLGG